MSAQRWPVITLGLILVNFGVFLSTHWVTETQGSQLAQVRAHILILAAMHPQLLLTPEVRELVTDFQNRDPDDWAEIQRPNSGQLTMIGSLGCDGLTIQRHCKQRWIHSQASIHN